MVTYLGNQSNLKVLLKVIAEAFPFFEQVHNIEEETGKKWEDSGVSEDDVLPIMSEVLSFSLPSQLFVCQYTYHVRGTVCFTPVHVLQYIFLALLQPCGV